MPWVSWRSPATSRMFKVTALLGLSGTGPSVLAEPPGLSGAPHAAIARTAARAIAILRDIWEYPFMRWRDRWSRAPSAGWAVPAGPRSGGPARQGVAGAD